MPSGSAVATISSAGGMGWEHMIEAVAELFATPGYEEAKAWCEAQPRARRRGIPALQAGDHHLDDARGDRVRTRGHPGQLHEPRPDRHPDDAVVRAGDGQGLHGQVPEAALGPELHARGAGPRARFLELRRRVAT